MVNVERVARSTRLLEIRSVLLYENDERNTQRPASLSRVTKIPRWIEGTRALLRVFLSFGILPTYNFHLALIQLNVLSLLSVC